MIETIGLNGRSLSIKSLCLTLAFQLCVCVCGGVSEYSWTSLSESQCSLVAPYSNWKSSYWRTNIAFSILKTEKEKKFCDYSFNLLGLVTVIVFLVTELEFAGDIEMIHLHCRLIYLTWIKDKRILLRILIGWPRIWTNSLGTK